MLSSMRLKRADALAFLHATLGVWLGIYAFRTYVPTAVWNLSDALPLYAKGGIAIGVHLLGIAGCVLPFTRNGRHLIRLAVALAVVSVLRQVFIASDVAGSALSLISWVLWLWWLAAFVRVRRDSGQILGPALAAGFAMQVAVQTATHGLDLPLMRGPVPIAIGLLISLAFVATSRVADVESDTPATGTAAVIAFGIALFLEITLLANVGRIGFMSGMNIVPAAFLIEGSLLLALLFVSFDRPRLAVLLAMAALISCAVAAPHATGIAVALVVVAQISLIALIAAAAQIRAGSPAVAFTAGAVALFALLFLFYNQYEWPLLWIIGAAGMAVLAYRARGTVAVSRAYAIVPIIGALIALAGLTHSKLRARAADPTLRVLTYNLHQGFDAVGTPGMQRIADEITSFDADVIAMQEVGRGWTFVGGADLVAYLQYRLPSYAFHFVPVNGQLWGVAVATRIPNTGMYGHAFDSPPGAFKYGYADAYLTVGSRTVHFVGLHLTAGLEGKGEDWRADQTNQLLRVAAADSDAIIVGDFNAFPTDPPIQQMQANYRDALALVGLGEAKTWPATRPDQRIDYVFTSTPIRPESGEIRQTTASDHLPVFIRLTVP